MKRVCLPCHHRPTKDPAENPPSPGNFRPRLPRHRLLGGDLVREEPLPVLPRGILILDVARRVDDRVLDRDGAARRRGARARPAGG